MKRVALLSTLILAVAALSVAGTYLWLRAHHHGVTAGAVVPDRPGSGPPPASPATSYYCPMHPTYVTDSPGDCPICSMRLVPTQDGPPAPGEGTETETNGTGAGSRTSPVSQVAGYAMVNVPARKRQFIGVQTAPAERRVLAPMVHAVGRVDYDETRLSYVNAKVAGWIEALHVDKTGQLVRRGQPLLDIYSPELVATQEEYLLALDNLERLSAAAALPTAVSQARSLLADARRRLALWDIPEAALDALESRRSLMRRLTLEAPVGGYVVEKQALEGQAIGAGETLFRIADLSQVWILAEVYESQAASIRTGQEAQIEISYLPGRSFAGTVDYVYPYLDPKTRTVRVRIVVPNPDLSLRPGMYASALFHATGAQPVLAVPNAAILDTGERRIAFVSLGDGIFAPRELTTGLSTRDFTEIRDGITEGELVVTSGNFLIDSESRLQAALAAMGSEAGAPGHRHGE